MAAAQAPGTDGSEGGGTSSREEALQVAQLGRGRHRGESGGPTRVRQKWVGSGASLTHLQSHRETSPHPRRPGSPPSTSNWVWGYASPSQNFKSALSFPKSLSPTQSQGNSLQARFTSLPIPQTPILPMVF